MKEDENREWLRAVCASRTIAFELYVGHRNYRGHHERLALWMEGSGGLGLSRAFSGGKERDLKGICALRRRGDRKRNWLQ